VLFFLRKTLIIFLPVFCVFPSRSWALNSWFLHKKNKDFYY
jgi:hypothetical protein